MGKKINKEAYILSVVVPVYNAEEYLRDCVDSILKANSKLIEILLVDDGSTDLSGDICDWYEKNHTNIKSFHKTNGGNTSARRLGVMKASADYITFLDADDTFIEGFFSTFIESIETHSPDVFCSGVNKICDGRSEAVSSVFEEGLYSNNQSEYFHKECIINKMIYSDGSATSPINTYVYGKVYKADLARKTIDEIPDEVTFFEDAAFVYLSIMLSKSVLIGHRCVVNHVVRPDGLTKQIDERYLEKINAYYLCMKNIIQKYANDDCMYQLEKMVANQVIHAIDYKMGFCTSRIIPQFLFDVTCLNGVKRIAIYGGGNVGKDIYRQLKRNNKVEIVAWVDKNAEKEQEVTKPEELLTKEYDALIIAVLNEKMVDEIKLELSLMGIDNKVVWPHPYRIVEV